MTIKIITVGSKSPTEHQAIIDRYSNRFPRSFGLEWTIVKNGLGDSVSSIRQESENVLRNIHNKDTVVLLDETGEQFSSPQLSNYMFSMNKDLVFVIGGAHGVSDELVKRADRIWSLSKLVFPHQLVRILLTEQLYRAYTIHEDHPYHHN